MKIDPDTLVDDLLRMEKYRPEEVIPIIFKLTTEKKRMEILL